MESTLIGNLVNLLNRLAVGNLKNANMTEYNGKSIALRGSIVHNSGDDLYLTVHNNSENISIIQSEEYLCIETPAQITIPAETLLEKNLTNRRFFSYAFKDDRFFGKSSNDDFVQKQNRQQRVESIIMSMKFIDKSIKDLEHPIQLKFEVSDLTDRESSECSYWKKGIVYFIHSLDEKNDNQFTIINHHNVLICNSSLN